MTIKHQPLITRHGTECICGVFCGSKSDSWLSHARDQVTLHPELGTSEFNFTASTPLSRSLQRAATQASESFAHVRKTVGRAFSQIKEPFMGYNALVEQGRRLASERDDLITSGVDPADLLIPRAPGDPE